MTEIHSEYEVRVLSFKLNQHGKADPVALGRLLDQLADIDPEASNVTLAEHLSMTEGTVRNKRLFSELARRAETDRSLPAPKEISKLPIRKVRELLNPDDPELDKPGKEVDAAKKAFAKLNDDQREAFKTWLKNMESGRAAV